MSSSRSRSSRPPLESLVYSILPSLAPPRTRPSSQVHHTQDGRVSAAGPSSSRPTSRADTTISASSNEAHERDRQARVQELMEFCEEILRSRMASSTPIAEGSLPDTARRMLAQGKGRGSSGGKEESAAEKALRFNGIWHKLEKGNTLASPLPHLRFLLALSSYNPSNPPAPSSSDRTSMPPPPMTIFPSTKSQPVASSSRRVLEEHPDAGNVPASPVKWDGIGKGKSKAEVLNSWRTSRSQPPFPQELLLRDALYLLQGIDGRYVRFALRPRPERNPYSTDTGRAGDGTGFPLGKTGGVEVGDGRQEEDEVIGLDFVNDELKEGYIATPTRTVMTQLSEMGVMYRRVTGFIKENEGEVRRRGMIEQSLCHFLHHELSEYHRLLAVLESQMTMSASNNGSSDGANTTSLPAEGSGLTLLRLGLWTEEMRLKMKMMAQVVDDARLTHGGALVSKIHEHTSHGDPIVRTFMEQVLEEVSKPFFSTLQRWIFSGELHDPFKEFFVQLNPDSSLREGRLSPYQTGDAGFEGGLDAGGGADEAHKVWEKKYVFVKGMKPAFVGDEFGKKIFSTGRSLNFIRYSCHDSDWIETQAKLANAGRALKYSDLAGLERSIDVAYSIASQRLLEIFFDKFALLDHLKALNSYLMLGAGDFAELLMDALAPRLSKPAASLYRHHLTSDLETALRASNAQYDPPDVLRRLDARVLEYSHGEIGWDCFALEYRVEAPLNAVLDAKAMVEYDRLFHHLWRLKRVERALSGGWMRITSGSRVFERLPDLDNDWHSCRIVQSEMVHFLRQLQAFCQLEVIECSWAWLMDVLAKREGDLDSLIAAHRTYLDRVVRKVLLLGSKRDKEEILLNLVREAMDNILLFRDATDDLYAWSLAEATRLDRQRDHERGITSAPMPQGRGDPDHHRLANLHDIRERIKSCSIAFQDRIVSICHLAGSHADLDVRFLAIRVAFNGYYSLRRSKGASGTGGSKSTRG